MFARYFSDASYARIPERTTSPPSYAAGFVIPTRLINRKKLFLRIYNYILYRTKII